jgi:hypothetical protein
VELTAISFNSSPSSGRGGTTALSIRQNFAAAVTVPEWVKGKRLPKDSPAAYAIAAVAGKIITIGASFATDPSGPLTVDIRADGGGVLGFDRSDYHHDGRRGFGSRVRPPEPATSYNRRGSNSPSRYSMGLVF